MRSLNPYEGPKEEYEAAPTPANRTVGWRIYFRVHLILVVSTGLLSIVGSLKINRRAALVKPLRVVVVPLVLATYGSLAFLPLSPLVDAYLLFKILRGEKKSRVLFIADSAVTVGHLFFISPIIS